MNRYLHVTLGVTIAISLTTTGQEFKTINNDISEALQRQGKFHEVFKLTFSTGIRAGSTIGLTHGMWQEGKVLQYSLNSGFMWRFGKSNLGNYDNGFEPNDNRSRSQFVFMFSPLLTTRLSGKDHVYQEVESFYYGTPSAVFSKFGHALTLGSTFTISPRGYRNVATIRNRAQQDFVLGVTIKNFNFTLYDDYFPFLTKNLQLGDNWDRFFTGGGFVRYRFSKELTMHLYSEVYTGINRANPFLYPDLMSYRLKGNKWVRKNMAYQDPGQEFFNAAWFFARFTYTRPQPPTRNIHYNTPNLDIFAGTPATWTMFSQNWIHNMFQTDSHNCLRLHYFLHRTMVPGNLKSGGHSKLSYLMNGGFIGAATSTNILKF